MKKNILKIRQVKYLIKRRKKRQMLDMEQFWDTSMEQFWDTSMDSYWDTPMNEKV